MTLARKCVPFTPFDGDLKRASVALVTAGGVHLREQEAFNIADELGDLTYRVFSDDVDSAQLMVTHHHYDHTDADADINVVFPIDVLRDLVAAGFIGGRKPGRTVDLTEPGSRGREEQIHSRDRRSHASSTPLADLGDLTTQVKLRAVPSAGTPGRTRSARCSPPGPP